MRCARASTHVVAGALCVWLAACAPGEVPATQLIVTIEGEPSVLARLRRVRASVRTEDSSDATTPEQVHDFVLATGDASPSGQGVQIPLSFGLVAGRSSHPTLVVEGYDALDASALPTIEQKRKVSFRPDQTLHVRVWMSARCYGMGNPCDLSHTCLPEARACGAIPEAELSATPDATTPSVALVPAGCPDPSPCSADYPCAPTAPSGYVCLGQRADWPVPIVGSRVAPSYDLSDPRLVVDQLTQLVWQRERPTRYEGCTGVQDATSTACTWDEARLYCSRLRLADRVWRLPSKAELESLTWHGRPSPTLDPVAFPIVLQRIFWTASQQPREAGSTRIARSWTVHIDGTTQLTAPNAYAAVRCVSGRPFGRGTPEQHFTVEEASDTVRDRATGLTWRRSASGPLASLEDAIRHCADGGAGWRLPDVKELLTLIDPTRSAPALERAFTAPPTSLGWASVPKPDGRVEPWNVDVALGTAFPERLAATLRDPSRADEAPHARCVRETESVTP